MNIRFLKSAKSGFTQPQRTILRIFRAGKSTWPDNATTTVSSPSTPTIASVVNKKNPRSALFATTGTIAAATKSFLLSMVACLALFNVSAYAGNVPFPDNLRDMKLAEGEGIALVRTVVPRSVYSPRLHSWMGLVIAEEATGKTHLLENWADPDAEYSVFVGTLPAGSYRLRGLRTSLPSQTSDRFGSTYSSNLFALPLLGGPLIQVRAGAISDLGTLLTIPSGQVKAQPVRNASLYTEQGMSVIQSRSVVESTRLTALIQQRWPTMAVLEEPQPGNGPQPVSTDTLSGLMVDLAPRTLSPVMHVSGALLAGEALGHIRNRAPNGNLSWLPTGLSGAITSLAVGDDGQILAGSNMGILMLRQPGASAWRAHYMPDPYSDVIGISIAGRGAFLLTRHSLEAQVLHKDNLDDGAPWTVLKRFSISRVGGSNFDMRANGGNLSILEHSRGWSNGTTLHRYVADTGVWTEREIPADWIKGDGVAALTSDGRVISADAKRGGPQQLRVSDDQGKTWRDAQTPDNFKKIVMQNAMTGFAERVEVVAEAGKRREWLHSLWQTDDAGLTWRRLGAFPDTLKAAFATPSGALLATSPGGQLFVSQDHGMNWAPTFHALEPPTPLGK